MQVHSTAEAMAKIDATGMWDFSSVKRHVHYDESSVTYEPVPEVVLEGADVTWLTDLSDW